MIAAGRFMMTYRTDHGDPIAEGTEVDFVVGAKQAFLERVAVEKQNIEILVQIGAGQETECVNPPSRGFRGGFNVDKSWSYGDGVARTEFGAGRQNDGSVVRDMGGTGEVESRR
ncbi:hypothetical protein DFH09DRAFT_1092092 [Mycena vulgaris]|nr:hypothetical protein DFH09DRAFT_1092092 [Mycena vulgaris]